MPKTKPCRVLVGGVHLLAACVLACGQQGPAVRAGVEAGSDQRRPLQAGALAVASVPEGFESLTLAPGFLLQMDVFGIPEMSMQLRVNARGDVTVPLIGAVHVCDLTVTQAQSAIATVLAEREILRNPQVVLNLLQYPARNISVLGEVQMQGRFPLLAPKPLSDVLALAGGATFAAGNDIEIRRVAAGASITIFHIPSARGSDSMAMHNTLVGPGDTVIVHRAGVIYVLGAVNRPGGYLMVDQGSLNVVQAISLAGGETPLAATHWATIVRKSGNRIEQIKVELRKMEKGEQAPAELQLDDALYIPASAWKAAVVNGSNVLSAAAAASIYAASSRP